MGVVLPHTNGERTVGGIEESNRRSRVAYCPLGLSHLGGDARDDSTIVEGCDESEFGEGDALEREDRGSEEDGKCLYWTSRLRSILPSKVQRGLWQDCQPYGLLKRMEMSADVH
jgi:hypothetical protein